MYSVVWTWVYEKKGKQRIVKKVLRATTTEDLLAQVKAAEDAEKAKGWKVLCTNVKVRGKR